MTLASICLLTEDVLSLTAFYEALLQMEAEGDATHMSFSLQGAGFAIYSASAARRDMGLPVSPSGSRTILSFYTPDVDAEYDRVKRLKVRIVNPPTTWPWGARSLQLLDPEGNLVTLVTPPKG